MTFIGLRIGLAMTRPSRHLLCMPCLLCCNADHSNVRRACRAVVFLLGQAPFRHSARPGRHTCKAKTGIWWIHCAASFWRRERRYPDENPVNTRRRRQGAPIFHIWSGIYLPLQLLQRDSRGTPEHPCCYGKSARDGWQGRAAPLACATCSVGRGHHPAPFVRVLGPAECIIPLLLSLYWLPACRPALASPPPAYAYLCVPCYCRSLYQRRSWTAPTAI